MQISEFFDIFDLSRPMLDKVNYYVHSNDYNSAKKELLRYFIRRKAEHLSTSEPISEKDKNFSLAYISRHGILSGPNENDVYLSSIFLSDTKEYTTMDIKPFLSKDLSFMIMSRQKEDEGVLLYSPSSIFPPYITLTMQNGEQLRLSVSKSAYISTKSPDHPLSDEDIYEICEQSASYDEPFGSNTGRVYLGFDLHNVDISSVTSARLSLRLTLPQSISTKELLFFNVADSSWNNSLTWNGVKGNVYSWENSPTGPSWTSPEGSDSEYLNVTCRFWFARPMAYQYLCDVEKNAIYGEKLLFLMDAFSKKKDGGFNRVLETGERLSNFTAVLNALIDTPVMTPDYLVSILSIMYRDMKSLMENPDLGWSNWAVVRTSGLSKAIDFLPELKMHEEWKSETRSLMNRLFDRMYSGDFSFREAGFSYSFWCMELFSSAFRVAQMNNDPYNAFMRSRLEKAFDASLDLLYPNFYDTNIGDSNYSSKLNYLKSVGSVFPTKKLNAFVNGKDDESIPLSVYYPYSKSVIMRNSFDKEKGIYLALHASPFDGHAHSDMGSLVLYANSRPLITDSGRYGYSQSEISALLKTPSAHNSIEIEGAEYKSHSDCDTDVALFVSNTVFDFATIVFSPTKGNNATHKRSVLFMKKEGYAIVSDYITNDESASKFNQHWHFMPENGADIDYNNHVRTHFSDGGNIKLVCPSADTACLCDSIFSAGYGISETSKRATFTKYGQNAGLTTLLLPLSGDEKRVSAACLNPEDLSFNAAVFDIENVRGVFYTKNTAQGSFLDCSFDGDMAFVLNGRIHIVNGSVFTLNNTAVIESPTPIDDMYIRISGGIVEIESSSLRPTTNRAEAIKIFAPKTTHVIYNGEAIPFTLYSDCVYAVGTK